jgi:endonuclease-3
MSVLLVNAKSQAISSLKSANKSKSLTALTKRADEILQTLKLQNPHPRCELFYLSPYQLLVSVVLSAQATDKSVNEAMTQIYKDGLTPDDVLAMGEEKFLAKIRRIGLAPTKAKNVLKLTRIIKDQYGGEIPDKRVDLEALPGVGRKTANVILGEIFREPTLAVDTHVYRVTTRLELQKETTPEKAEAKLMKIVAPHWLPDAHHWFILLGRYTCVARNPKCEQCVLNTEKLCPYPRKNS